MELTFINLKANFFKKLEISEVEILEASQSNYNFIYSISIMLNQSYN